MRWFHAIGIALVAALGLGVSSTGRTLAAESPTDECFAFFSGAPNLPPPPPDAKTINEKDRRTTLPLRPNVDQQVYVYVFNPKDLEDKVIVSLHAVESSELKQLPAGSEIARTAQEILIGPKQLAKVALVGKAAPPAPASTPKPADKETEAAPTGTKLPNDSYLYLRVQSTIAPKKKGGKIDLDAKDYERTQLSISIPSNFQIETKAEQQRLAVTVKFPADAEQTSLSKQPAKVRLDLRPDINPLLTADAVVESTLEADLPIDSRDGVTLFAKLTPAVAAKLADLNENDTAIPRVLVSVDGYERAFIIKTKFTGNPKKLENTDPFMNVRLSSTQQVPGKPVLVTAETENIDVAEVTLRVKRFGDQFEVLRKFPTDRQRDIYLRHGDADAIVLRPVVKDWTIEYPTNGAVGVHEFDVKRGGQTSSPPRKLLLDNTKPKKLAFITIPANSDCLINSTHTLEVTVEDAESGVAAVWFYTGALPPSADGKPATGSKVVRGIIVPGNVPTYRMEEPFKLPGTTGEFEVGVLASNAVGLTSVEPLVLKVIEPPKPKEDKAKEEKPKKTTGSIVVRVMQSTRMQPGLPVTLADASGKVLKTQTTDGGGATTFKDLQPGEYTLKSVKRADQNANGTATATVEAGDTPAIATITVRR